MMTRALVMAMLLVGLPTGLVSGCRKEEAPAVPTPGSSFADPVSGMQFVYVKGGCYRMGDTFADPDSKGMSAHEVCVGDLWLGQYEVTQGEWSQVMTGVANPSDFQKGPRYPVENVNWFDAQEFIKELNRRSGRQYRLPTEAEWEYAARSGGKPFRFGTGKNTIGPDEANFDGSEKHQAPYSRAGEYRHSTLVVGSFAPNRLGLYDMTGNVWEWCADWYGDSYYARSERDSPQGPTTGSFRVFRGGSWYCSPSHVRAAYRNGGAPSLRAGHLGFRLVLSPDRPGR